MFEGLRGDRRSNRDQKAQDVAVSTAANLLARRQMQQATRSTETAETAKSAKPTATVAQQLGAVARNAATVYGQAKPGGKGDRDARSEPEAGQTLTVGAGIQLKGEITNCQTLIVEGHVEGSAKSSVLQIADGGAFAGEAGIDTAVVSGNFEGTLTASERLVIRASGRVSGNIRYAAIAIEAGGQISGDIQVIAGKAASLEDPASADTESEDQPTQSGEDDRVEIAS
jgi:cytoskeletal protein CcmA (bactofilin family)